MAIIEHETKQLKLLFSVLALVLHKFRGVNKTILDHSFFSKTASVDVFKYYGPHIIFRTSAVLALKNQKKGRTRTRNCRIETH